MRGFLLSRDEVLAGTLAGLSPERLEDDRRLLDGLLRDGADYVLLDMRQGEAWEFLTALSDYPEIGSIPVLLLVEPERLDRLSLGGAVDFVTLPPDASEIRARLRLFGSGGPDKDTIVLGDLTIDVTAYQVRLRGRLLEMTYMEFELLRYLASRAGRVISRRQLLNDVWGYENYVDTRTVDIHVRRLRVKLGPEYGAMVETVRQVGYRFSLPDPDLLGGSIRES